MSKKAFRSEWRLPTLLALLGAPEGRVTLTELSRALDIDANSLSIGFHSLVSLGVLVPKLEDGQRKKFHDVVTGSSVWAWVNELEQKAAGQES